MSARVLVVAKAPEPGRVKTRLAATVGPQRAARLAGAALLDTLRTCTAAVGPVRCRLAVHGDLETAEYGDRLLEEAEGWTVITQRGEDFATRLANAHLDLADEGPVVQIGMDTPQVSVADLLGLLEQLEAHDAVLAEADDGGWWGLGLADPRHGARLADVTMSTSSTGAHTRWALEEAGLRVGRGQPMRDVDTADDAEAVARICGPGSEFARVWEQER